MGWEEEWKGRIGEEDERKRKECPALSFGNVGMYVRS
jgi:hypothetical protein